MAKSFYSRLSYSFGNEDWQTEQEALQIQPDDHILCITASGDRPLNLLSSPCKKITTIDSNPFQTALLDLKKTALQKLSYEEYLAFLGINAHKNRMLLLNKLSPHLSPSSCRLWSRNLKKIRNGVLYSGAVEQWLKRLSFIIRLMQKKKIEELFSFEDIEKQKEFLHTKWNAFLWKQAFNIFLHPFFTRLFIKDPGLYEYVDSTLHIGNHLHKRFNAFLHHTPARHSVLLSLILKGKVLSEAFPPYLGKEGTQKIKKKISKLHFQTIDLLSYLKNLPPESVDCFSLSDVASYLNKENFDFMIQQIHRVAKPQARFCIRQFLSNHQISKDFSPYFKRNFPLEKGLEKKDKCFVYRFTVGEVIKE